MLGLILDLLTGWFFDRQLRPYEHAGLRLNTREQTPATTTSFQQSGSTSAD